MDDTERAELIAALNQAATFAEGLLDLNGRLFDAVTTGANRPDADELEYLRAGLSGRRAKRKGRSVAIGGADFAAQSRSDIVRSPTRAWPRAGACATHGRKAADLQSRFDCDLAIGIAASTATFSIADAVLMRPLPVHEQRTLSVLWGVDQAAGSRRVPVPYGAFKGFVDASPKTLSAVAGLDYHGAAPLPVREGADSVNLKVALVTGNLFSVLGVTPLLGRNLQADDDSIARGASGRDQLRTVAASLREESLGAWPRAHDSQPGTIVAASLSPIAWSGWSFHSRQRSCRARTRSR